MTTLYNILISIADFFLKIIAPFNEKVKKGVDGRGQTFEILEDGISSSDKTIWFHCASLGEYEQGLPVFKEIRKLYQGHKIILTFFSPSGYEIRKNSPIADIVVYLPMDTRHHAKQFVSLLHPDLTVFVKYDIWPNYLNEIKRQHLQAILISALFRKEQSYFKNYGGIMRKALRSFQHIFVQNIESMNLLKTINFENVTLAGDTRYDRVSDQLLQDNKLPFVEQFKNDKMCVVLGSSWPEDETLFIDFINATPAGMVKFIIAPHNIKKDQIDQFVNQLQKKTVRYSDMEDQELATYEVFVVDTIGFLSKIYSEADIAYVGGAMGQTGLHNILEPAVFGVPIIIGKNYRKFPEAFQMIANGGVISIKDGRELDSNLNELIRNQEKRERLGQLNASFILRNKGAVDNIMNYLGS